MSEIKNTVRQRLKGALRIVLQDIGIQRGELCRPSHAAAARAEIARLEEQKEKHEMALARVDDPSLYPGIKAAQELEAQESQRLQKQLGELAK